MATRSEIEAEVQRIVEDRVSSLDDAIVTHIQRAQSTIEDRCLFRQQHALATIDVVPTTVQYALPSDFIAMRRAPFYLKTVTVANEVALRDSGERVHLTESESFEELGGDLYEADPPRYWRIAVTSTSLERFEFWPRGDTDGPEAGGAYRVVIPYWKRFSTLSAGTSTHWLSQTLDDVLSWAAAASLFSELRDPAANFWAVRAEARLREFVRTYRRNTLRQKPLDLFPSETLSARTSRARNYTPRRIVAEIP